MGILIAIIVGFVVGLIARALIPGNQPMGLVWTTVLGIVGSLVGAFVFQTLGLAGAYGWIASILGAVLVLLVYGMLAKRA